MAVLANPRSGRHRAADIAAHLTRQLRAAGHEVLDLSAPEPELAVARTREQIAGGGLAALLAVGGDGTAHWAVNAVAGTDVALGVVPAGSGNDNARTLGMPPVRRPDDLRAYAAAVTAGRTRRIDLGHCSTAHGSRWWLGVLGAGFDTIVNARSRTLTRLHGTPRYLAAVAVELPRFRGIPYLVTVDGDRRELEAMLVAVGNGGTFGGGMRVCPDASVTEGVLDVLVLRRIGRGEFLTVFPRVFNGSHVRHPAVEIVRGSRVRVEAPGLVVEADGEEVGPLPADLQVRPAELTVLVP